MQRTSLILVLALAACSSSAPVVETPVPPAAPVDHAAILSAYGADAVLWQHTSAEAYRLFQQGYELARLRLDANLAVAKGKGVGKFAVIVDIDETVLDNSPYQIQQIKHGTVFDQDSWKTWTDRAEAKACPGALEMLHYAENKGAEVFYISNRNDREKASTIKNLQDLGFPFADEAHLLLMDGTSDKTERRAMVSRTHGIVLLIGDQLRDFDERFKDRQLDHGRPVVDAMKDTLARYFVLLPNPMYGTYRDAVQGKGSEEEKAKKMETWFKENAY